MAQLLLAAHDSGGANILASSIDTLRSDGHVLSWCGGGPAASLWREMGLAVVDFDNEKTLIDLMCKTGADLLVTGTSGVADLERLAWSAARRFGVASFAVIDAWMNYRSRLTLNATGRIIMPDALGVTDQRMRDGISEDGIRDVRIHEIGQPHLEALVARLSRRRARRKGTTRPHIVFFSEGIREEREADGHPGYDQYQTMQGLLAHLGSSIELDLSIVPHPLERWHAWSSFLKSISPATQIDIKLDERGRDALLGMADGIIGMTSMVLVEAALLGLPVMSLQPQRTTNANPTLDQFEAIEIITSFGDPKIRRFFHTLNREIEVPQMPFLKNAARRFAEAVSAEIAFANSAST